MVTCDAFDKNKENQIKQNKSPVTDYTVSSQTQQTNEEKERDSKRMRLSSLSLVSGD